MVIGEDFYYDGQWLSLYEMKMGDPESEQEFVSRDIDKSEITSVRSVPNHFSVHYSDTKVLEFLVIKDPCKFSGDEFILSGNEINDIRSWLESAKTPQELIVYFDDADETEHYFGLFTSVQPYVFASYCYGLRLTFTCNAPYGFSDTFNRYIRIINNNLITEEFHNYSAEKSGYLKPIITINSSSTFGSNESLLIINSSDNSNRMEIDLPRGKSSIIIDCSKKIIVDGNGNLIPLSDIGLSIPEVDTYNFITADSYCFYWLRLVPGLNILKLQRTTGNTVSSVNISGRYILKTGGF